MTFTISQTPSSQNLYIYPTSDSLSPFEPSAGSNNYAMVDDVWNNPNTSDYVYMTDVTNLKDRYTLTDHTSETGTINYVKLIAYAKADFVSTAPTLALHTYLSATEDEESAQALTGSYSKYYNTFTQDPGSGAWSWTDIDNVLAGFKGTIADREFYYKTKVNTITRGVWVDSDGYVFACIDEAGLRVYSYVDGIGFTTIDTDDQGGHYTEIFIDPNDVIFIGNSSGYKLLAYTFNGTALTHEDDVSQTVSGVNAGMNGCHGDENYIYAVWSSSTPRGMLRVYEYSGGTLTAKDYYEFLTSYGNCQIKDVYYDGTYIYVVGLDVGTGGRVWAFSYNSGTDTLTMEDTFAVSTDAKAIYGDGTYIYVLYNDYIRAYTCSGGTFSASLGSQATPNAYGNKIFCDDDDYIYCTYGTGYTNDYFRILTFNGTTFTTEQNFAEFTSGDTGYYYWPHVFNGKVFVGCESDGKHRVYNFSKIDVAQFFVVVNYTPSASVVTLTDPKTVEQSHSRKIIRKTLPSGNYIVYDAGRGAKTLTITGTETSGAYSDMNDIKTICHYGAKVTVAGLDDTNFNTDYWVSDIQFSAGPGYPANMYDYKLTLEEL